VTRTAAHAAPEVETTNAFRILVVDDTETHRQVVRTILTDAGYDVIEARDGIGWAWRWPARAPDAVVC